MLRNKEKGYKRSIFSVLLTIVLEVGMGILRWVERQRKQDLSEVLLSCKQPYVKFDIPQLRERFRYCNQSFQYVTRNWTLTQCCESNSEEPGAGNLHAGFCGGGATAWWPFYPEVCPPHNLNTILAIQQKSLSPMNRRKALLLFPVAEEQETHYKELSRCRV